MKKKLLFVVHRSTYFVSHRIPLALTAVKEGYDVHVAALEDESTIKIRQAGLTFHPIPFTGRGMNIFKEVRCLFSLIRLFRQLKPDIIHQLTIKPILYGTLAARLTGVKKIVNAIAGLGYVFADDQSPSLLKKGVLFAYRLLLKPTEQWMIFQNQDDQKFFIDHGIVTTQQSTVIAGSGVNPNQFVPNTHHQKTPPLVLLASRMIWDKGVKEFAEAAEILSKQGVKAQFALVGSPDPNNPNSIPQSYLEGLNKKGFIHWMGHQNNMANILAQTTIFCLPSFYREGIPKVLLEAAACGIPIITSDMPGCRDAVKHNYNGLLVTPKDSHELARAIDKLLKDKTKQEEMGKRGRELVMNHFTESLILNQFIMLYASL